jgi:hypothetical protein
MKIDRVRSLRQGYIYLHGNRGPARLPASRETEHRVGTRVSVSVSMS